MGRKCERTVDRTQCKTCAPSNDLRNWSMARRNRGIEEGEEVKTEGEREEPAARNNYTRITHGWLYPYPMLKTSREVHSPEYPEELCRCTDWFYDAPLCSYLARHRLILRCCRSFNASLTPNIASARPIVLHTLHTWDSLVYVCVCMCWEHERKNECLSITTVSINVNGREGRIKK